MPTVSNKSAQSEVNKDMAAIKDDVTALKEDLGKLLTSFRELAKGEASAKADQGAKLASEASDKVVETSEYFENHIRKKPITSVAAALLAGVFLASLRRH